MSKICFNQKFIRISATRLVGGLLISFFALFFVGCETEDDNKLASAQECLDNLRDSDAPSVAQNCANKVAGLSSPESYVIRCSVDFFLGGVTSSDITDAFNAYETAPANLKAATLMAGFAQTSPAFAQTTFDDCVKSEVPSLIYIATISQVGTLMTDASGGSTDPAVFLPICAGGGSPCDEVAIGTAVTTMYSSYCIGDAADTSVCKDIATAIAAGGSDPVAVANALYAALQ